MNKTINLILGTMTFGEQLFENDVVDIVKFYLQSGYNEIDTAYVYNNGKWELSERGNTVNTNNISSENNKYDLESGNAE